jgi:hypothetical protein
MSVALCVPSMGDVADVASGIVSVEHLQRHERSPIIMGANFTYRSVFEKGLAIEVLVLDPEAITPEDDTAPVVGGGAVEVFVGDNAEDFTEAAARFMAARPLALVTRS